MTHTWPRRLLGMAICGLILGGAVMLQRLQSETIANSGAPIAHWTFNSAQLTNQQFAPKVGRLPMAASSRPTLTPEPHAAMLFQSPNDRLTVIDKLDISADWLPKQNITLSAVVRVDRLQEWGGIIGCLQDNGDAEKGVLLGIKDQAFTFALASKGADDGDGKMTYLTSKTPVPLGKWVHLVGTYDGKQMALYVNGALDASSVEQNGPILWDAAPWVIGRYQDRDEDYPFTGAIHEAAVYDSTLPATAIADQAKAFASWFGLPAAVPTKTVGAFLIPPYLQYPTQDRITVMWETPTPTTGKVKFGLSANNMDREVASAEPKTIHEVTLTGLKPSTRYIYQVSGNSDGGAFESEILTFSTAVKPDEAFSFGVIGDTQRNPVITEKITKLMFRRRPNFVIHCGDVVDDGPSKKQWVYDLFQPGNTLFSRVAVFPTIGNHEKNHPFYYQYFSLPNPEYFYTFQYGNAEFFVIDSNKSLAPTAEQYRLLEQALAKSRATWKFAYHHHPLYSSDSDDYGNSFRGPNEWGAKNPRFLEPLYEKYNMDIVFNGHIHVYERSYPIRGGRVDRQKGIIHVTSGGGGARLEEFAPTPAWFKAELRVDYHYCNLNIQGNRLSFKAFDQNDQLFDYFDLAKE
ncbi:LamG-like jellyroll fold domain-containing protein [Tuwongella immobilis]|uniref:Fibronectin type-III domain-containing protein n=1 Tax=Tuwongella immobilis TaxID=692036 RepID=A0A6C2YN45_9BACT|nr:LamG-like jellyroll fold domain-containing protein [Tuwongella immobilis]VIP02543.1 metallophosphoesterase : Metallophosphoesterase OS=Planctomyces limnophilus (strain ATCC 43296 / DSM 3776 / IFAM 1008 / 290) GN=Plim_2974 PE=4 SV=1: Laminin_G_3: Metallophos [Tuwongella immobilis]VTS01718.1 metallophosphoesterase : Metallophosphoesterase OS=Planctomyces limnophilus (strain ATCC 43296 / DSM 3776 / IFAM 1008 / 290) GN=Plim_2974 PE=4 SV=1: Laminin_G_3: Metallophos [Tuwongella immobilis]